MIQKQLYHTNYHHFNNFTKLSNFHRIFIRYCSSLINIILTAKIIAIDFKLLTSSFMEDKAL